MSNGQHADRATRNGERRTDNAEARSWEERLWRAIAAPSQRRDEPQPPARAPKHPKH
jgi:hypothetical protein